jgi:hypothetical protein
MLGRDESMQNVIAHARGAVVIGLLTASVGLCGKYGGGAGEKGDPYLIDDVRHFLDLQASPDDWAAQFRLTRDLDLGDVKVGTFDMIGTAVTPFGGVFDGGGHAIANLSVVASGPGAAGLFGVLGGDRSSIENLRIVNARISAAAASNVGVLVGLQTGGTISDCVVEGGSVEGREHVGGLGGQVVWVSDCRSSIDVLGVDRVGGLVGTNRGTVFRCGARGTVGGDEDVGGLVGLNSGRVSESVSSGTAGGDTSVGGLVGRNDGTIDNCLSASETAGFLYVGGLVGLNDKAVSKCLAVGFVAGDGDVGGLIGRQGGFDAAVRASFWDPQTTGQFISGGGTAATTEELHAADTYLTAGWDMVSETANGTEDIWCIYDGSRYPQLRWTATGTDLDGDGRTDFRDFALLASRWRATQPGYACADPYLLVDGAVDFIDLGRFSGVWLASN